MSMPPIAEAIRGAKSRLINVGIPSDEASIEARSIVRYACGFSPEQLLANHAETLSQTAFDHVNRLLARRETREPLAYVLGETEFYGRPFDIDNRSLIPRPETELLIDLCLQFVDSCDLQRPKVCDIGTGSGIIAITLATELLDAELTATDVDIDALKLAKSNAAKHGADVEFKLEDAAQQPLAGNYDIVVSNPPYIRTDALADLQPEVRDWEPRRALDGGADGMDILRPLIGSLPTLLRQNNPAVAFIEIDPPVAEPCLAVARETLPDAEIQIHLDFAGLERVLVILRD